MAQLLIKALDAIHINPKKDKSGCEKTGDIVAIVDDKHIWGKRERLPRFIVIKVPELSIDAGKIYIESEIDEEELNVTWNRLTYESAKGKNDWQAFLSEPTIKKEKSKTEIVEVDTIQWAKMLWTNNYYPFYNKPTGQNQISEMLLDLTGEIKEVELTGIANVPITKRLYSINVNPLILLENNVLTLSEFNRISKDNLNPITLLHNKTLTLPEFNSILKNKKAA